MAKFVYADNAATTKLDQEAFEAMKPWLLDEYGNASQPYSFSRKPKGVLKKAREIIAECINALPEEVFFTSGGTESDNWAIKGTMLAFEDYRPFITSEIEHHAVLHSAAALERLGYPVVYLPVDSTCTVSPDILKHTITDDIKLVSVMYSNNEVGSIQPIAELTSIAHKHGALFHTDAVQAVGHAPIDVKTLAVDMLSASAHKFNGPKGIGFLYVRKGTPLHSFNDGGSQEAGMRAGTENIAAIAGMATALKVNCEEIECHRNHLFRLESKLLAGLTQLGFVFLHNGANDHIPGNISLSFKNADGEMLLHRLDLLGICVSTGSACDSKNTKISHVLKAMHIPEEYARGTIRISLGKDNSSEDVEIIISSLKKILG